MAKEINLSISGGDVSGQQVDPSLDVGPSTAEDADLAAAIAASLEGSSDVPHTGTDRRTLGSGKLAEGAHTEQTVLLDPEPPPGLGVLCIYPLKF